ncbi:MAG: FAD-dependent monooxygenase [Kutzneria sp.]|nr:FAD-dependent monooxygenase [Kutzneria sp.]
MTTDDERVPVLIVGGGYAGLTMSLFLANQGIRSLLVDRHPGPPLQGRARGINVRTMEIYRSLGIADAIADAGKPFENENGVAVCQTLADPEWQWLVDGDAPKSYPDHSAGHLVMADQTSVEPILMAAATSRGADQRFNILMVSFAADRDGVTAVIEDRTTGRRRTVRADYLIAADGNRSGIREQVGVARPGYQVTQPLLSILFDADLDDIITKRALFWMVRNPEIGFGGFVTTATPGRWGLSIKHDPSTEPMDSISAERLERAVRATVGKPGLDVRIVDVSAWEEAVGVAERFRDGRVFLVGDAAHVWPPAGAMGANSAVQDAHNLAWKLAAVLNGQAGDGLLDSYEAERRPVALELSDLTVRRQRARARHGEDLDGVDDLVCLLGQRYRSVAVLGAEHGEVFDTTVPVMAQPGARAPHLWLEHDRTRVALHDLFNRTFVLLTDEAGEAWCAAAAAMPVPVRAYRIGTSDAELIDLDKAWPTRSGVREGGAVLVRSDGYVAWRSTDSTDNPQGTLAATLRHILDTPKS